MESIDVQNRSFVVRWVKCARGDVINYQVKPLKKSIDVEIYKKHKATVDGQSPAVHIAPNTQALLDYTNRSFLHRSSFTGVYEERSVEHGHRQFHAASTSAILHTQDTKPDKPRRSLSLKNIQQQTQEIPLKEKLISSDFHTVRSLGHIPGNILKEGTLEVKDDDYYYAFILDNTASKNIKKKVLFNASVVGPSETRSISSVSSTPFLDSTPKYPSLSSVPSNTSTVPHQPQSPLLHQHPTQKTSLVTVGQGRYLQGYLLKKRRKVLQGFKKRFFSLDFKYGTLSYYLNEHNQTCRGEVLVNLSTVSANKKARLIVIDSGMEIWVLKSTDEKNWQSWVDALQSCFAAQPNDASPQDQAYINTTEVQTMDGQQRSENLYATLLQDRHDEFTSALKLIEKKLEKCKIESLSYSFSMMQGGKESSLDRNLAVSRSSSSSSSSSSLSQQAKDETPICIQPLQAKPKTEEENSKDPLQQNPEQHQLYNDLAELEAFVAGFIKQSSFLQAESRRISRQVTENRKSIISGTSDLDEFFDAEEMSNTGVILLPDDENDVALDNDFETQKTTKESRRTSISTMSLSLQHPTSSGKNLHIFNDLSSTRIEHTESKNEEFDISPVDLYPLPWLGGIIKRRNDVPCAVSYPPSLLSILRKHVGKDLTSIAMPVATNEPISILQLLSEAFEYADILLNMEEGSQVYQPIAIVTAFAISSLSIYRDKTRALRKPFNPLLGETYELVREDMGFRLIAEKVSHKPPIYAIHAEHADWECSYTVSPVQRFWGKSVELNNEGIMRLRIKALKDTFEWAQPTIMLKNLIAGERYMEPINEFEVNSKKNGAAKIVFATSGMFSGRSEDLTVNIGPTKSRQVSRQTLVGKWTKELRDEKTHETLWKVGDLVADSKKKYGFTKFTANLNEITNLEKDQMAPTDSRLRPDIRAYEQGDMDMAEKLKLKLEQQQRDRRNKKEDVKPSFFKKVSDRRWDIIRGPKGYWERRRANDWADLATLW